MIWHCVFNVHHTGCSAIIVLPLCLSICVYVNAKALLSFIKLLLISVLWWWWWWLADDPAMFATGVQLSAQTATQLSHLFVQTCLYNTRSMIWGFDLPRQQWSLLNHFRTEQGHCGACRRKWRRTDTDLCPCGEIQTMSHIGSLYLSLRPKSKTLVWDQKTDLRPN